MDIEMLSIKDGGRAVLSKQAADALSRQSLSLSSMQVTELDNRRVETLRRLGRFEIEPRSIELVVEQFASSPYLLQSSCAEAIGEMVELFLELRNEVPVDVGDEELASVLRENFDDVGGDTSAICVSELASTLIANLYSPSELGEYRIIDNDGREYVFNPSVWEYDEQAPGWDGEEWADDFEH